MTQSHSVTVPQKLVGVWRRIGLIIDNKRVVDYCDVLWLQSDSWFADIRLRLSEQVPDPSNEVAVAFAKEGAFAGIASWSEPTMTWQHLLDVREKPPTDVSPVRWQNGGIIEGGTMTYSGKEVSWAEEWIRLVDDSVEPMVRANDKHAYIEIGDYAIEVKDERPNGRFVAIRFSRVGDEWDKVGSVTNGD